MLTPSSPIGSSSPHSTESGSVFSKHNGLAVSHSPEKSGLPSAVRGAGALMFTLPAAVLGTPVDGYFNHCAPTGIPIPMMTDAAMTSAADFFGDRNMDRSYALPICCADNGD